MFAAQLAQVSFRRTEPEDLDYVLELEADPNTSPYITPWSREQHRSALTEDNILHLVIQSSGRNERVGFAILRGLTTGHRNIEFMRIVIGDKRKGLGRAALRLLKRYVFEQLGAHRMWLDVKLSNKHAKALYGSEGFVVEGVLRECLKGSAGYDSLVMMSLLENEYRQHQAGAPE